MIYFTADTHFGQSRTCDLSKRPFANKDHMDETIIGQWNATVSENDVIYHLGDWGELYDKFGEPYIEKLNGTIRFLPSKDYDQNGIIEMIKSYKNAEFIEPNTVILDTFQLVHEPLTVIKSDMFFLFGHIHKLQMIKRNGLCVSQDAHHFFPISLDDVYFYRNAILTYYDENVFIDEL